MMKEKPKEKLFKCTMHPGLESMTEKDLADHVVEFHKDAIAGMATGYLREMFPEIRGDPSGNKMVNVRIDFEGWCIEDSTVLFTLPGEILKKRRAEVEKLLLDTQVRLSEMLTTPRTPALKKA